MYQIGKMVDHHMRMMVPKEMFLANAWERGAEKWCIRQKAQYCQMPWGLGKN